MHALFTRRHFSAWLAASVLAIRNLYTTLRAAEPPAAPALSTNLTRASNAFAFALLKRLSVSHPADNQFLSPFSIESALAIAMEGAREQTAAQMGLALQFPGALQDGPAWDMQKFRNEYAALISKLTPSTSATADQAALVIHKKNLEALNARLKKLSAEGNNAEWDKVFVERTSLSLQIEKLEKNAQRYELAIANSLWVEKSFALSKDFQQTIQQFYGSSEVNACDFLNKAEAEGLRINSWVQEQTRDKIKDIIPPGALSADTRLVIANAIYFKGDWVKAFDKSQTTPAPFTHADNRAGQVNMMVASNLNVGRYAAFQKDGSVFKTPSVEQASVFPPRYPDDNGFQALELPYQGDSLSMVLLLPGPLSSLNKLVESMTAEKFAACYSLMERRSVHVKLPRFKMETRYDLIPDLRELGMQDAFSSSAANFSGLVDGKSGERLYITLVIHKAFIEVNEQGTEAAAATIVGMELLSAKPQKPFIPEFTANRPFLAAIVHKPSGTILFVGKVESPPAAGR